MNLERRDAMDALSKQIEAYEEMRDELEMDHFGEWVVFHDEQLVDTYPTFPDAAHDAARRYGRGPYLIRQVGASRVVRLPASVEFGLMHGGDRDGFLESLGTR